MHLDLITCMAALALAGVALMISRFYPVASQILLCIAVMMLSLVHLVSDGLIIVPITPTTYEELNP